MLISEQEETILIGIRMEKLAIIGSRTFALGAEALVLEWLKQHLKVDKFTTIVSGGAPGADTLAEKLAERLNKKIVIFHADFKRYKKRAGVIRNGDIARTADFCLALVDKPLKESLGTYDCVKKFTKLKKPVIVLYLIDTTMQLEQIDTTTYENESTTKEGI